MRKFAVAFLLIFATASFANFDDDSLSVQQGAEQENWQTCVDNFSNPCLNECATSEDINCKDNCLALAKDRCTEKGLSPETSSD